MLKRKRLLAMLIDYLIILMLALMPFVIIDTNFSLVFEQMDLFFLMIMILLMSKDLIFINASIGKRLLKIKVVNENNERPSIIVVILRNAFLILWPIELILVLAINKRIGDIVFRTKVVSEV